MSMAETALVDGSHLAADLMQFLLEVFAPA